ncbi:MAG: hypothetical protein NC821_01785 [Candidatus Omnitrophica bacterium]|nr:hypothetical protein [Candidatus Omnitrophota bacterium]
MRNKKIRLFLWGGGVILFFITGQAESRVRTQITGKEPERNVGIIDSARTLDEWQKARIQIKKNIEERNRQLDISTQVPENLEKNSRESTEERVKTQEKIQREAQEMKQKIERASPNEVVGENPDGTKWYQYSGRFDIFKNWIKEKLQELGLLDKWKGESFEELVEKYPRTNFSLTINRRNTIYSGKNTSEETIEYQFSLSNVESFDEYIQSRTKQFAWDSINNKDVEIIQTTVTDQLEWGGVFYGTPGKTEKGKQMLHSRQRTWDETHNTYSEITQRNFYEGNFHMPIKTIRQVYESGTDDEGRLFERRYEMIREKMQWLWVSSPDPETGGSYELKSFDQTVIDYNIPDKKTFSHHELNYSADGVLDNQLIVTHETGPGLDFISVSIEKYLDHYKDNSVKEQLNLNVSGDFSDLETAINSGRKWQDTFSSLKKGDKAFLDKLVSDDGLNKRFVFSTTENKYNEKGFLAWQEEEMTVRAKDSDGSELNFTRGITRNIEDFTPFGQAENLEETETDKGKTTTSFISRKYDDKLRINYEHIETHVKSNDGVLDYRYELLRDGFEYDAVGRAIHYTTQLNNEVTPDVETTTQTWLKYDTQNQVIWQKNETFERGRGESNRNRHIISEKDNIQYNQIGLEIFYQEKEEEFDTSGEIMGNRFSEVSEIKYNQDGLQTGYRIHTTTEGEDENSGEEIKIETETILSNIVYDEKGMRLSWEETTRDSRRGSELTSQRTNEVLNIDRFGRITEMKIEEHTFGDAEEGNIDTQRTITRRILSYNASGEEEKVEEIVEDEEKTTTSTIENSYDEYGRVIREERNMEISGGGINYTLHLIRDDIEYNSAGLEKSYTEKEEKFDTGGNLIGNSFSETSQITYNSSGQMTGYETYTVVEGTDLQDGSHFSIETTSSVTEITYNEIGVRTSWHEVSTDTSRGSALTTERSYSVNSFDEKGRITEIELEEYSYGSASDGSSLETERRITREITYGENGLEEEVVETVEEGAKITVSTINYEYDEAGRISYEEREIYVNGEEEGVVLDYSSVIKRYDFVYNDAGLVQHYISEIENEASDLQVKQEVDLGYNERAQVDYQRTETWENGVTQKRDKYGAKTGEEEEVNRHTISEKYDITYNEIGLETYWQSDETVWENGELIREANEEVYDIVYDSKGRMLEYTIHKVGSEKITDEESDKYGQWQDVNITTQIYNITYIDGLDLRKSWEEYTTGTINGQQFKPSWRYYEVLEFDRFGDVVDIHVEGDGVEEEGKGQESQGTTQNQGTNPAGQTNQNPFNQTQTQAVSNKKLSAGKRPARIGTLRSKFLKNTSLRKNIFGEKDEEDEQNKSPLDE